MKLDTRRPKVLRATGASSARETQTHEHSYEHWPTRIALIVLSAFVGVTAIGGAIFVVPTMPRTALHQGVIAPFADYTIPAFAMGILGGCALLAAFATVIEWPRLGALTSIIAGIVLIGFELVEILVVGFTPVQQPTQFPAWLQPLYIVLGGCIVALGVHLWRAEAGSYDFHDYSGLWR